MSAIVFSGCAGSDSEGLEAGPASSAADAPPAEASTPPGSAPAAPPLPAIVLAVQYNGTALAPENGTYVVPVLGNVTFDASASTGSGLSFAWDFGDGTTGSNATETKSYSEAGTYAVVVNLTDSHGQSVDSLLNVTAILEETGPKITDKAIRHTFTGTIAQNYAAASSATFPRIVKEFPVPENAFEIQIWLRWRDAANQPTNPADGDLDLYLLHPKGTQVTSSAGFLTFEYIRYNAEGQVVPGLWKAQINPYVATQNTYTMEVLVFMVAPTVATFTGTHQGATGSSTSGFVSHKVTIPDDASVLTARLAWTAPSVSTTACSQNARAVADYHLFAFHKGASAASSANLLTCEFLFFDAADGQVLTRTGEFDFRVVPNAVASGAYTLTVVYA